MKIVGNHELFAVFLERRPESHEQVYWMEIRDDEPPTFRQPQEVSQASLAGVRLAVYPGDIELSGPRELNLVVNDLSVNLAQAAEEFRLDLTQHSWQVMEVPFSAFRGDSPVPKSEDATRVVSKVGIEGNVQGTFYLDDFRLVEQIPSGLPDHDMTAVLETSQGTVPAEFELDQNHPNPFNSQTVLGFSLPRAAYVHLLVYNIAGQEVAQLVGGFREAGSYTLHWDGRTDAGDPLATGIYIYRLQTDRNILSRKLLLIR